MAEKMNVLLTEARTEGIKEFIRMILIAVIPVLISFLTEQQFDFKVIGISVLLAVLRAIDKFLHESNSTNPVTKLLELN